MQSCTLIRVALLLICFKALTETALPLSTYIQPEPGSASVTDRVLGATLTLRLPNVRLSAGVVLIAVGIAFGIFFAIMLGPRLRANRGADSGPY